MEENQNTQNEVTSKSSYKGVAIFLVIFGLVAITATFLYANSLKKVDDKEGQNVTVPKESGESQVVEEQVLATNDTKYAVEYDDMYFTNNIKLIEKGYVSGDFVTKETYGDTKYYEENATYFQIDGLKDEEIENKINKRITDEVFAMFELDDSYKVKVVRVYEQSSFSNMLSFRVGCNFFNEERYEEGYRSESICVNIDLSTGEDIEFEDLFLDSVSVKSILTENIYATQQGYVDGWWGHTEYVIAAAGRDPDNYNYSDLENDMKRLGLMTLEEWESWYERSSLEEKAFEIMQDFMKGNLEFYITEYDISLYNDGYWCASINLRKNLKSLALYKRFMKEESIFDNKYNVAEEGMCGFQTYTDKTNEKIMENLLLSNTMYVDEDPRYMNRYRELHESKLAAEKEYALVNPDKMFILGLYSDSYSAYSVKVEMDKEDFEKNKDAILETYDDYWMHGWDWPGEIVSKSVLEELGISCIYSNDFSYYSDYDSIAIEDDFYLLDSHTELVTSADLENLTMAELNFAYNEIFARHGHDFQNKELKEYFAGAIWYRPVAGRTVALESLSAIEQQNLTIIRNEINARKF